MTLGRGTESTRPTPAAPQSLRARPIPAPPQRTPLESGSATASFVTVLTCRSNLLLLFALAQTALLRLVVDLL